MEYYNQNTYATTKSLSNSNERHRYDSNHHQRNERVPEILPRSYGVDYHRGHISQSITSQRYYHQMLPLHNNMKLPLRSFQTPPTEQQQQYRRVSSNVNPSPHQVNPPSWASPARGESSLEPVGDTAHTHSPIDLTCRRWFRIGRSPSSDVPLLHSTSSRRHALMFHHPSGPCFIADCHSAHGTFIDGVRVLPYPHSPKRVRRGALIRFGGPGAPSFVLKSFSVKLEEMVFDLGGVAEAFYPQLKQQSSDGGKNIICESSSYEDDDEEQNQKKSEQLSAPMPQISFPTSTASISFSKKRRVNSGVLACIRGDGGGVACIADGDDAPEAALVLLNTRLNALGKGAMDSESNRRVAHTARTKFAKLGDKRKRDDMLLNDHDELQKNDAQASTSTKSILKKSFKAKLNTGTTYSHPVMVIQPEQESTLTNSMPFVKPTGMRRVFFSDEKPPVNVIPSVTPNKSPTSENIILNESGGRGSIMVLEENTCDSMSK